FPRLCHEFLNLCRRYHTPRPPSSLRSRQLATDVFRKTTFRPYCVHGNRSTPPINPRRKRWTVATLQPSVRAVSLGVNQSRDSVGGRGRRLRGFLLVIVSNAVC